MSQKVKLRRSAVPGNKPTTTQLDLGELAINTNDGKLYFEKSSSLGESIEEIIVTNAWNTGSISVSGSVRVSGSFTNNGLTYPLADNGALSFIQSDGAGNLTLQYVNTMYETVRNMETSSMPKGTPIYISGSTGANPNAYFGDAGNPNRMPVVYIAGEDLAPNQTGLAIVLGLIEGVNTSLYPPGTEVYVAVGGGWTATRPTGSAIVQSLGYVTKQGVGGQGVVLNPGPYSLPNLNSGSVWIGNNSSVPTVVPTSSLVVDLARTASYVATASYIPNLQQVTNQGNITTNAITSSGLYVTGSATITGNLNVIGTASFSNVTSSVVIVGDSTIILNTDLPSVRFGGIEVIDSGSFGNSSTGSLLWDSLKNHWIYSNPSGSTYDGGMILAGPKNTSGLGNEEGVTNNAILKGQGGDHVTSSAIIENGASTNFYNNAVIITSGSSVTATSFTGSLLGTSSYATQALSASYATNALTASYVATSSYVPNLQEVTNRGTSTTNAITSSGLLVNGTARVTSNLLMTGSIFFPPGTGTETAIDIANRNIIGINRLEFNDPGPTEGILWNGGNLWAIYESPNDLITNTAGNLQFVQSGSRKATITTTGQLDVSGSVIAPSFTGSLLGTASYASQALSSSYALNSTSASYALNSTSASYALNATSASYALNSTSASYSLNSTSASYALNSTSASYALNSTSASYALSSSYALNATSASYATQALSSSYALNSTSASYALTSSILSTPYITTIAGTSNQVLVNGGTAAVSGAVTLTLPQSIATTSTPQFAGLTVNGLISNVMGTTLYSAVNTGQFVNITAGALSAANLAIGIGGTSIGAMLQGRTSTASSRLHLNPYGGNVLIGKGGIADSGELLQVQGAASVSGNTTVGGTLGVTGTASVGQLTSGNGTGERYVTINGGAGSFRYLELQSSGSSRWVLRASNTSESGSNAGSDLQLIRYSDVGANLGTALSINRATGLTTLSSLSVSGTLAVTGAVTLGTALGVASGGTGLSTTPTNGQLLIGNGTNYTLATLTGTANQVTVTNGAGTITLSLPQSIATTSTVRFGTVGIGIAAATVLHAHATSLVTTAVSANYSGRFSNNSTAQIIQLGQGTAGENVIQGGRTSDNTAQPLFIQYYGSRTIVGGSTDNGTSTFQVNGTTNITGNTTIGGTLAVTGAVTGSSTAQFTKLGLGAANSASNYFRVGGNITGNPTISIFRNEVTVQSDVTTLFNAYISSISLQATSFTLSTLNHFIAQSAALSGGASVTNQNGFIVDSNLIGATNNYGFRGTIPSGSGRWNIYMDGTANNYFAGNVQIGSTTPTAGAEKLQVTGIASVSGNTYLATGGGNVGIGTTSPAFANGGGLEIERAGIATLRLQNTTASNSFELYVDTTANGINFYGANSSDFIFSPAATTRFRISTAGVLTLTTTPTTSAGGFDLITRNTSTGVLEKVASNYYATAGSISGTTNYIPKFTTASTLGDSIISEGAQVIAVNGDRLITLNSDAGRIAIRGESTSWANSFQLTSTDELVPIRFGALGTNNAITYAYIGTDYNTQTVDFAGSATKLTRFYGNIEANDYIYRRGGTIADSVRFVAGGVQLFGASNSITWNGTALYANNTDVRDLGTTSFKWRDLFLSRNAEIGGYLNVIGNITGSNLQLTGNAIIAGNLTVNGTVTYISSSTLVIGDNFIEINANKAAGNSGMLVYDTTSPFTASIVWDATADRWKAGPYNSESTIILASDTSSMSVLSASYALNSTSASYALNATNALTASYVATASYIPTLQQVTTQGNSTSTPITSSGILSNGSVVTTSTNGFRLLSGTDTLFSLGYTGGTLLDRLTGTNFFIAENGSPQFAIIPGGNVGIGITSPTGRLTIAPYANANSSSIEFTNADNAVISSYYSQTFAVDNTNTQSGRQFTFAKGGKGYGTQTKTMMVIDADSGYVGIGTTSLSSILNTSGSTQGITHDDSATGKGYIRFRNGGNQLALFGIAGAWEGSTLQDTMIAAETGLNIRFYTNGSATPKMYISGSGNVGIGTTSPTARLSLGSSTNGERITWSDFSNIFSEYSSGELWLSSNFYGNLGSSGYKTSLTATYGAAGISVSGVGAGTNGALKFFVDNATSKTAGDAFTPTEQMRITGNGNVGIGTTNPTSILSLYRGAGTGSLIEVAGNGNTLGTTSMLYGQDASSNGYVWNRANAGVYFATNNSIKMYLSSAGSLGIGTTNPTVKLQIEGGSARFNWENPAANYYLYLNHANTQDGGILWSRDASTLDWQMNNAASSGDFFLYSYGTSTTPFYIKRSTGNVGIGGTTSPNRKLEVTTGNGSTDGIRLTYGSGVTTEGFDITYNNLGATTTNFDSLYNSDASVINFRSKTAATPVNIMTLLGSGNVGIGNTSPTAKLYIESGSANWNETTPGLGVGTIHLDPGVSTDNFGNAITFGASDVGSGGTAQAGIYVRSDGSYGTKMYFATTDTYAAGSKTAMFINNDGKIGIGTTSPGAKLDVNGNVRATSFTGSFSGSLAAPGSNTQVIYNNSGNFGASSNLTFDGSTLNLTGTLTATVKSFIIDHPTKPEKKLQYGVLEGPEHSVYIRGKNNTTRIELPDYWYALVNEETITVNLTAIGRNQNVWVEQITDKYIDVNFEGSTCTYFYTIFAERKDIDKLVTEFDK